jgi:starvation-inducible outer membrane lipoprotein
MKKTVMGLLLCCLTLSLSGCVTVSGNDKGQRVHIGTSF